MKKILLVSHGNFAKGIKDSLNVVVGSSENVETITIYQETTRAEVAEKFKLFEKNVSDTNQVFVITDIVAGSTSQYTLEFLGHLQNVVILSGLNLGMLLEIYTTDTVNIENNLAQILEMSKGNIKQLNTFSKNDSANEEI